MIVVGYTADRFGQAALEHGISEAKLRDTVASSIAHVRRAIDDKDMTIDVIDANEPSPISRIDDEGYALMESTISATFPEAVVTPGIYVERVVAV